MTNSVLFTPEDFANQASFHISKELLASVANFEGYREKSYRCLSSVLTVGFGHTLNVTENTVLPLEDAKKMLYQDLLEIHMCLMNYIPHFELLPECYRNMLIDLAFNCGTSYFAKSNTELHRIVLSVSFTFKAHHNISSDLADMLFTTVLRYCHSNGRVLSGLLTRRFYYVKQCILWHEKNSYLESAPAF